ncbi:ABC transporter ATP-binding protein [Erysipelothrix larvae]|uniref:ABC transporter ATP-binding protein n=1 Tax=Erysipelothrix larvae TaxID=1514105 RepID=A0A109UHN8_9FIRM|nr:sugar ABC transporter ATP-binding protein [Erysipelothrix larvae]AMC94513.1 ABC transporter ATP-binding protein [Erysipelothrix larvae]
MQKDIILEMQNITKEFGVVKALSNVNFQVERNTIHALCGENGAGKSTLMKVLSGVYPHSEYSGNIYYDSQTCQFQGVRDSEALGIVIIHQELALIPNMTIVDNIFLGNEIGSGGVVDYYQSISEARRLLSTVGLNIDPLTMISELSVGQQQLVEIAKAVSKKAKLLILDEPTAALNETESANLLDLIKRFKQEGVTSIIISHKLNEIMSTADHISVLRDGCVVDDIEDVNPNVEARMIKSMVGRDLAHAYPEKDAIIEDVIFEVKNWNVYHELDKTRQIIRDVSLNLRAGEIVGIAGLMGSGRTELALSLFGKMYGSNISGEIILNGKKVVFNSVKDAIDSGLAYVTEDRKEAGLILNDTVNKNISLSSLDEICHYGVVDQHEEVSAAEKYRTMLNIKTPSVHQQVGNLSGGNQQKVVLSKWLMTNPDVLILDEPTRGIDVGAKFEIYKLMNEIARVGKGVIMISSDLPELIGMSDRVYALCEGRITGEIPRDQLTEETVMQHMLGVKERG